MPNNVERKRDNFVLVGIFTFVLIVVVACFGSTIVSASADTASALVAGGVYSLPTSVDTIGGTSNLEWYSSDREAFSITVTYGADVNNTSTTTFPCQYIEYRYSSDIFRFNDYYGGILRYIYISRTANSLKFYYRANTSTSFTTYNIYNLKMTLNANFLNYDVDNIQNYVKLALIDYVPSIHITRNNILLCADENSGISDAYVSAHLSDGTVSGSYPAWFLQERVNNSWVDIQSISSGVLGVDCLIMRNGTFRFVCYTSNGSSAVYSDSFDVTMASGLSFALGYEQGLLYGNEIIPSLIGAIPDTVVHLLIGYYDRDVNSETYHTWVGGLFGFEIFGYDMRGLILSLVSLYVVGKILMYIFS